MPNKPIKLDLDRLPIVTFVWSATPGDRDSLTWISAAAQDLFGHSPDDILADLRLITYSEPEIEIWKMRRPADDAAIWEFESSCEVKGQRLWWRAVARCVAQEGNTRHYHGAIFDVSDLKARDLRRERRFRELEASLHGLMEKSAHYAGAYSDAMECLDLLIATDPGTGALSWRDFAETLQTEYYRSRRHGLPISLLDIAVLGLDSLAVKRGGAAVDEFLSALVARLSDVVRPIDSIGRLGDGRFAALLPGTPLAGARIVAERLTKQVEDLVEETGGRALGIETSFEVREINTESSNLDQVLGDLIKA